MGSDKGENMCEPGCGHVGLEVLEEHVTGKVRETMESSWCCRLMWSLLGVKFPRERLTQMDKMKFARLENKGVSSPVDVEGTNNEEV